MSFVDSLFVMWWSFHNLYFFGHDVFKRIDGFANLFAVGGDTVWHQAFDDFFDAFTAEAQDLVSHDFLDVSHSLGLSICGFLLLILVSVCGGSHEHSESISVGGGDFLLTFNKRVPFFDGRHLEVPGFLHTVEHQLAVSQVDVFADKLVFGVGDFIVAELCLKDFVASVEQIGGGQFVTDSLVGASFSDVSVVENGWDSEVVPFFSDEWIDSLLFSSFL